MCNRVVRILKSSSPSQWLHVISEENPADLGTRSCDASQLQESLWLRGPSFLYSEHIVLGNDAFPLMNSEFDKEIRPGVEVNNTQVMNSARLGTSRFKRFSKWKTLVSAITLLLKLADRVRLKDNKENCMDLKLIQRAENLILREVQCKTYHQEISALQKQRPLPSKSFLLTLTLCRRKT